MQTCQFRESDVGGASNPPLRTWSLCVVAALRTLHEPAGSATHRGLHTYLTRAECDGELSELSALLIQALLAMSEESEFAVDYLDMADAVATTELERTIVAETRAARDWLVSHPAASPARIQATLVRDCEAMRLWNQLLVALCRLGDSAPVPHDEWRDPCAA